jgi:hypothetical protein
VSGALRHFTPTLKSLKGLSGSCRITLQEIARLRPRCCGVGERGGMLSRHSFVEPLDAENALD